MTCPHCDYFENIIESYLSGVATRDDLQRALKAAWYRRIAASPPVEPKTELDVENIYPEVRTPLP